MAGETLSARARCGAYLRPLSALRSAGMMGIAQRTSQRICCRRKEITSVLTRSKSSLRKPARSILKERITTSTGPAEEVTYRRPPTKHRQGEVPQLSDVGERRYLEIRLVMVQVYLDQNIIVSVKVVNDECNEIVYLLPNIQCNDIANINTRSTVLTCCWTLICTCRVPRLACPIWHLGTTTCDLSSDDSTSKDDRATQKRSAFRHLSQCQRG